MGKASQMRHSLKYNFKSSAGFDDITCGRRKMLSGGFTAYDRNVDINVRRAALN
jgi:hypothetical protein